jgi:glucosamine-6-phosphate deaminase
MIDRKDLYKWCKIGPRDLARHAECKAKFRLVWDSNEMGQLMAKELADAVEANAKAGKPTRAIIPCGPACWYAPWTKRVNSKNLSLRELHVFHMDECLDWQGRPLAKGHPYNFRSFMENHFYGDIRSDLNVPEEQRHWLLPSTMEQVRAEIARAPIDLTLGGWGQDGHVAYNQARRSPYSQVSLEELAESSIRIQENNLDTIIALGQRTFGSAWQFVPPMSVTLGMKECLSAAKVRVFSDTGAWKQTALRIALFCPPTPEYPMTLLQRHKDAIITATMDTAKHPIHEHPEWELF